MRPARSATSSSAACSRRRARRCSSRCGPRARRGRPAAAAPARAARQRGRHVNLIVPPTRADCDAGFIIMEPTEYPPMSGSNTICATTVLLETGMLPMHEPETSSGSRRRAAWSRRARPAATGVRVRRVHERPLLRRPPRRASRGRGRRDAERRRRLRRDVLRDRRRATRWASRSSPARRASLAGWASASALAAREQLPCAHPENPAIRDVSIVQIAAPWKGVGAVTRNAVVVAPGGSTAAPRAPASLRAWRRCMRAASWGLAMPCRTRR